MLTKQVVNTMASCIANERAQAKGASALSKANDPVYRRASWTREHELILERRMSFVDSFEDLRRFRGIQATDFFEAVASIASTASKRL